MYLITYQWVRTGIGGEMKHLAYEVVEDPVQWIIDCQGYSETYFLLNQVKLNEEQIEYFQHNDIKGM